MPAPAPEPGPPWTHTAGFPSGLPHTSQYTRCPSPTSSRPWSYGSIAGYGTGRSVVGRGLPAAVVGVEHAHAAGHQPARLALVAPARAVQVAAEHPRGQRVGRLGVDLQPAP